MESNLLLTLFNAFGGLGLFLLGMIVMTDGLRALAGDKLQQSLMRFTKSPYSGALTGTVTTALLQSSSATTVAAIGFVGAGLMGFSQALGIIFGANIGTTITGWMVALLGFKLQLGTIVLPLILLGVILKLFFKDKISNIGYAIAGFGLIFVGISLLQEGMSGFEGIITPESLPSDTWSGRLQLVLLGMLATILTQSSSAGVATTLAALFANAINFEQAAALIIGMDIGTTVTALFASIGGNVHVRRTGYSHVIYNFMTGTMAILLITPYTATLTYFDPHIVQEHAELALVGFHTFFNTLGVIIILPFAESFARMMKRIIPSEKPSFSKKLDVRLYEEPYLALEATRHTIEEEFLALMHHINALLGAKDHEETNLTQLQIALTNTQHYLDGINPKEKGSQWKQVISLIHVLDHMHRLHERCFEEPERAKRVRRSHYLEEKRHELMRQNALIIEAISLKQYAKAKKCAKKSAKEIHKSLGQYRADITTKMANDEIEMHLGTKHLQAMRWLVRTTRHISRICYHLEEAAYLSSET
jgi:phosphate:Na+ symporter